MLRPPPSSPLFPYTTLFRSLLKRSLGSIDPPDITYIAILLTIAMALDRKSTRLNSSHSSISYSFFIFFFNATPPPELSPLSLHDALPISFEAVARFNRSSGYNVHRHTTNDCHGTRSEEHTSELQSQFHFLFLLYFFF